MEKIKKLFIGTTESEDAGWLMASCGSANDNSGDYVITTNKIHSTDVPEPCTDAKTFSQFVAGLLNMYYSDTNPLKLGINDIIKLGEPNDKVVSAVDPKLPF